MIFCVEPTRVTRKTKRSYKNRHARRACATARESEMCYSLGTSVGDVTRVNVANVVRFSLYIYS